MRPFPAFFCVFPLLLALLGSGCASAGAPWVELKGQRIAVEIADDPHERGRGLMEKTPHRVLTAIKTHV